MIPFHEYKKVSAYLKIEKLPTVHFMFSDRYEIHIQAFTNGFVDNLSFSDPHLHNSIFEICTQSFTKNKNENEQKHCTWDIHFRTLLFEYFICLILSPILTKICFQDVSIFSCVF